MQARARDVRPLQQPKLRLAAQLLVLFLVPAIWLLVSTDYITSIASAPRQSSRDLDFVAKPGEALAAIAGVKRIRSFRLHQHPEIPYLLVASPYEPALLFSFDASGHLERVLDIPVKACRDVVGFTLGDSSWILPISGAAATSPLYRVIALSSRDGGGVEGDTAASIRVQHVADVETQGASSVSAFVRGGRQPEAVVVMTHPRSGQLSAHRMTAADPGGLTRPFQRIDLPGVASLGCCEAAAAALSKGSLQADGGGGADSLQYLVAAPHQAVDGYEHVAHLLQYDGVQLTSIQQFSVQSSRRISCWVDRGRLHVSAASSRGQEDAPVPSPLLRSSRNGTLAVQQQIFVSHARDVAHFSIGGLHLLAFASYGFSGACRKDGSVLVYEFMPSTGRYVLMTIIRTPCATSVEFVHAAARHFLVIGSDLGRDDSLAEQLPASTVWEMHVKKRAAPQVAAFLERDGAVRGQDLVV